MSIFRNLLNAFVPVRERRETNGTMANGAAEIVHDLNGDESATIYINGGAGSLNATFEVTGSPDGTNYYPVLFYPYTPGCTGGTIPVAAQPMITEAVNATGCQRTYCLAVGQLRKLRVRYSSYTSGSAAVNINSETQASIHPNAAIQRAGTLFITATAAAGSAATATLPLVTGLRHYVESIRVTRTAAALLTAAATQTSVTTTNLPGSPQLSFGQDAAAQGVDKVDEIDCGPSGLAATAIGTATTVVCPATPNVIWRVNVAYRLGL